MLGKSSNLPFLKTAEKLASREFGAIKLIKYARACMVEISCSILSIVNPFGVSIAYV
jgi:hypothetical protein